MTGDIYFMDINGKLVTNRELARMALITKGENIYAEDLDSIRNFAKLCKGITKEVTPDIKTCLKNGDKVKAITIYYDNHPGLGLKNAKNIIDVLESVLRTDDGDVMFDNLFQHFNTSYLKSSTQQPKKFRSLIFRLEVDTGGGGYGLNINTIGELLDNVEKEYGEEMREEVKKWAMQSTIGDTFHKDGMNIIMMLEV